MPNPKSPSHEDRMLAAEYHVLARVLDWWSGSLEQAKEKSRSDYRKYVEGLTAKRRDLRDAISTGISSGKPQKTPGELVAEDYAFAKLVARQFRCDKPSKGCGGIADRLAIYQKSIAVNVGNVDCVIYWPDDAVVEAYRIAAPNLSEEGLARKLTASRHRLSPDTEKREMKGREDRRRYSVKTPLQSALAWQFSDLCALGEVDAKHSEACVLAMDVLLKSGYPALACHHRMIRGLRRIEAQMDGAISKSSCKDWGLEGEGHIPCRAVDIPSVIRLCDELELWIQRKAAV